MGDEDNNGTGDGDVGLLMAAASSSSSGTKLRRRHRSTTIAEEIVTEELKQRRAQPDRPVHRAKDSYLSWGSGFQHFEGVMNWAFLMLAIGGIRLFLENFNKYGWRIDPMFWIRALFFNVIDGTGEFPTTYLFIYSNLTVCAALVFEKLIAKGLIGERFLLMLHGINLAGLLVVPVVVINQKHEFIGPVKSILVTLHFVLTTFKLFTYAQVNKWNRGDDNNNWNDNNNSISRERSMSESEGDAMIARLYQLSVKSEIAGSSSKLDRSSSLQLETLVQYPDNLHLRDIYYFWMAPTLCYEVNFPRSKRIRKFFLLRRLLEVLIGTQIVLGLLQQWIFPSVMNSLIPFSEMHVFKGVERILKLAIPNHMIWLTSFYLVFHSVLNASGELLRFADREFYYGWWNANNILEFWKTWNVPVHRFCVRHIFKPMLRAGYSVSSAQLAVFAFSAFFHEYAVSVPLRVFKVYAFMGMLVQMPLIPVTLYLEKRVGPRAGNICVWLSLVIGQPMALMMYYHDYVVEHYGKELISYYGNYSNAR